jgi:Na+-translocating ferredoxin:NAD+ oxidoreductase RnfE subunit
MVSSSSCNSGALRELSGTGALFANTDLLFGQNATSWKIVFAAAALGDGHVLWCVVGCPGRSH